MIPKHTHGEWKSIKTNNGFEIQNERVNPEKIVPICFVHDETLNLDCEANVKLIVSSPLLLEALQYYFDVLKEVNGEDWDKKPDHVLSKMINAVKQATE